VVQYLEGSEHVILILSNHKNLKYFAITKQLTHHQVHWSEYLSGFNYFICYHARWLGTKPDALTCHEDVYHWGENAYACHKRFYWGIPKSYLVLGIITIVQYTS